MGGTGFYFLGYGLKGEVCFIYWYGIMGAVDLISWIWNNGGGMFYFLVME